MKVRSLSSIIIMYVTIGHKEITEVGPNLVVAG